MKSDLTSLGRCSAAVKGRRCRVLNPSFTCDHKDCRLFFCARHGLEHAKRNGHFSYLQPLTSKAKALKYKTVEELADA